MTINELQLLKPSPKMLAPADEIDGSNNDGGGYSEGGVR